ncbi:mitochondrial intermembrane space import and assembly protein 40 [Phlyctema vagabunda]|uniref:Mitochondrial intermembrane space import and assembly protein 40 n=1 Tax=Phlyctema vagabunda TaxID=108571 RepID=A0ABR4PKW0_9HELO
MFKSAIRTAPRRVLTPRLAIQTGSPRRLLSTAPPTRKSRSWKSSGLRWGLAIGAVYYYNTSTAFAEEPEAAIQQLNESIHSVAESDLPTVEAIVEEKRAREAQRLAEERKREQQKATTAAEPQAEDVDGGEGAKEGAEDSDSLEELEDEADAQGAFNPVTGEINWDCPCLGGMAHGPCGEEFRAAFSCFVYSKEEPKGVECIEKFKGMQDCFREHPEVYGSELEEDEVEEELQARDEARASEESAVPQTSLNVTPEQNTVTEEEVHRDTRSAKEPVSASKDEEASHLVPSTTHVTPQK